MASGAGSAVIGTPCTFADVSNIATLRTEKVEFLYASLASGSATLTITGATHANGCSPGNRKSDTKEPEASFNGPSTRRTPGTGMLSALMRMNSVFNSAHVVGFAYSGANSR